MVVHKKHSAQIETPEDTQILNVDLLVQVISKTGMLSEEPVLDEVALRVDDVYDWICVPFVAGCENGNLKVLVDSPQTFLCEWSGIETTPMRVVTLRVQQLHPGVWLSIKPISIQIVEFRLVQVFQVALCVY
jgi:hypothetical protein